MLGSIMSYLWNIFLVTYIIMNFYNKFGSKRNITEKLFIFNKEIKKSLRNIVKDFMKSSNKTRRGTRAKKSILFSNRKFSYNQSSLQSFATFPDHNKYNFAIPLESHNEINEKPLQFDIIQKNLEKFTNENNENFIDDENKNESDIPIDNNNANKEKLIVDNNEFQKEKTFDYNNEVNNKNSFIFDVNKKDIPYYNYNKNEYQISFITFLLGKIFKKLNCCKSKISKSYELHESTCSFYDYYMDINTYLKMMIEFDILKSILLGKRKNNLLKKFRPIITRKYKTIYNEKLENFYTEKFSNNEINKIKRGMECFSNERNTVAISSFAKYI